VNYEKNKNTNKIYVITCFQGGKYMFKKIISLLIVFALIFTFCSCSSEIYTESGASFGESYNANYSNYSIAELADETSPVRKIMYEVDITFNVSDMTEASDFLKAQLNSDEWFDREEISTTSGNYTIRVRTDRLDDFVEALKGEFSLRSYSKVGTDISLDYQDATNRIISLEAQLERLLELYDEASISDMIQINEELSDVQVEIDSLQGELNQFDSLVDYSLVNVRLYGSTITTNSPFFNRLGEAFVTGFNGLISFFDGFFIVIATIIPFIVVFGGVSIGVIIIVKKKRNKNKIDKPVKKNKGKVE
jgi:hypothetical protein